MFVKKGRGTVSVLFQVVDGVDAHLGGEVSAPRLSLAQAAQLIQTETAALKEDTAAEDCSEGFKLLAGLCV